MTKISENKNEGAGICCIDFGTSTTAASVIIDGEPHLVRNGNNRCFPTAACVLENGDIEVCDSAMGMRTHFPDSFKSEFKLNISEPLDIRGRNYTDIVSAILAFIRRSARIENNGREVCSAILTIPALYTPDDPRVSVMREAAIAAGFKDVTFMSEAVAAAMHYNYVSGSVADGITLIYDLGGGTFDPVLIRADENNEIEILAVNAGAKCGGQYFDKAVYDAVCSRYKDTDSPLLKSERMADYEAARRIKETLSASPHASQLFSNGQVVKITREEFSSITSGIVQTTIACCSQLLKSAGKEWCDLSRLLFVGGSSIMPVIEDGLRSQLKASNAASVELIRNFKGINGAYDYRFATTLGGLTSVLKPAGKSKSEEPVIEIPPESNDELCPVCGYALASDDIYCSMCGHRLGLTVRECQGCGAKQPFNDDNNYCIHCGTKL